MSLPLQTLRLLLFLTHLCVCTLWLQGHNLVVFLSANKEATLSVEAALVVAKWAQKERHNCDICEFNDEKAVRAASVQTAKCANLGKP